MLSPPIAVPHRCTVPSTAVQVAAVVLDIREHIAESDLFDFKSAIHTTAPYFLMLYETKEELAMELARRAGEIVNQMQLRAASMHGDNPNKEVSLVFQCLPAGACSPGERINSPRVDLPVPVQRMKLDAVAHIVCAKVMAMADF